ncbi:MAG: Xaa-Pro peptidase family protein [Chloroflexota bacterium]|nr:Xaa-Pro peptidase family protein [Chloroflexota bacterium]
MDALIAVYPKNVFYYSGSPVARSQLLLDYLPEDPGRRTLAAAVVPGNGGNILVCPAEHEAINRDEAWVEQIQTFDARWESPMEGIARAINHMGLSRGRLGIEATYLTVAYRDELQHLLPAAELVPSDTLFEWIRALKIPSEIELLKQAADILDDAMLDALSSAKIGDTEWELHSRILEGAERRGAEHCRGILHAGDNAEAAFSGAGLYKLAPGDIIRTDYAAFLHGYPSNLSRVAVVGEPTTLQQKIYANLISGHRRIWEFMRPGVTGREVFEFSIKAYADLGYFTAYRTILGHSLGLGYHERPMLTAAETMPLRVSMVFALEPKNLVPYHIQDQVVVGEYDTYLQSDKFDTRELFVVGA